jgi:hypothetical protein
MVLALTVERLHHFARELRDLRIRQNRALGTPPRAVARSVSARGTAGWRGGSVQPATMTAIEPTKSRSGTRVEDRDGREGSTVDLALTRRRSRTDTLRAAPWFRSYSGQPNTWQVLLVL